MFAEYAVGRHNLRYTMNYIDDYEDQRTSPFLASPDTNNTAILNGKTIDSTIFHDFHYLVDLPWEMALSAIGRELHGRGSVAGAPGSVLRSVHVERLRAHLQGRTEKAFRRRLS